MSYYDKSSVGRLVTRTVSDMETIASIFSQGLFMIFADLILMFSVLIVMIVLSVQLSLIILIILPFVVLATQDESTKVSMVSVSRTAFLEHFGQSVSTNSLLLDKGDPSVFI